MGTALVTGISGQDGKYLAGQLLEAGYRVVGLLREGRVSRAVPAGIEYAEWDFKDVGALTALLRELRPSEFYNLAAFSSGAGMYDDPVAIGELNGIVVARVLRAILDADASIRFCQASSSEMFGDPMHSPQDELTPFRPCSPYGAAKLFAHTAVQTYRLHHGLFACSAILYNHESPLRGHSFVTRKIVDSVARIRAGLDHELRLGNLDAQRDWGYAPDYVRAMRLMMAHDDADDYVVATGRLHSVREFCELAFSHAGLRYQDWVKENAADGRQDRRGLLVGDSTKARRILGWYPSIDFGALVRLMVDASIASLACKDPVS